MLKVESEAMSEQPLETARKAYVVFAMAVGIACGRGDAETADLRADVEWCTREHGGGDGESRRDTRRRL